MELVSAEATEVSSSCAWLVVGGGAREIRKNHKDEQGDYLLANSYYVRDAQSLTGGGNKRRARPSKSTGIRKWASR
jgi:hypothetical protein